MDISKVEPDFLGGKTDLSIILNILKYIKYFIKSLVLLPPGPHARLVYLNSDVVSALQNALHFES